MRGLSVCGIVGLFLKETRHEPELGRLTAAMLAELCDRGPDSAGFAVYGNETAGITKICAVARAGTSNGPNRRAAGQGVGASVTVDEIEDHAISGPLRTATWRANG
jgi:glutamate synthase domain-containing protein 1